MTINDKANNRKSGNYISASLFRFVIVCCLYDVCCCSILTRIPSFCLTGLWPQRRLDCSRTPTRTHKRRVASAYTAEKALSETFPGCFTFSIPRLINSTNPLPRPPTITNTTKACNRAPFPHVFFFASSYPMSDVVSSTVCGAAVGTPRPNKVYTTQTRNQQSYAAIGN